MKYAKWYLAIGAVWVLVGWLFKYSRSGGNTVGAKAKLISVATWPIEVVTGNRL